MLRNSRTARLAQRLVAVTIAVILSSTLVPPRASAALGDCSQPSSSGTRPAATDCLFILNVAVGLLTCTPECICAPKGSLPPAATDALVCLQVAVNQPVALNCPCNGTTTTTTVPTGSTTTTTVAPTTTTSTSTTSTTLLQCPVQLSTPEEAAMSKFTAEAELLACGCLDDANGQCDGTCPDEAACLPNVEGDLCRCQRFDCGGYMGATNCYGLCAAGSKCVFVGDNGCGCLDAEGLACGDATAPACDGACGEGEFCHQVGDACECVDVTCGNFGPLGTCFGICPGGEACVDLGGGSCSCQAN